MIDYALIFLTVFLAVLLANIITIFGINKIVSKISRRAGYNYQKGRKEFINDEEKQYVRKRV